MSDFVNGFLGYYIAVIALGGIAWCLWLLFSQRAWLARRPPGQDGEEMGHVWDGDLRELNNPVPRWWTWMYLLLCLVGLGYLALYPGLGTYQGLLGYTTAQEVQKDAEAHAAKVAPLYARYASMDVPAIAADAGAIDMGQRLFLNTCAQCHGSDAKGSPSFPNLTDRDWLYGGEPDTIIASITNGRHGMMPPHKEMLSASDATDIAHYVRSLSGLAHDQIRVIRGKRGYEGTCAACHGADGKGNPMLGAPNLTDDVWLYGSSERTIVQTIMEGRENRMPAHDKVLTPEQIRIVAAWVWRQSNDPSAAQAVTPSAVEPKQ
ncbi:Cytochrome c oxidase subunit CcoP [plant metagenome]|uniref:Cytochrome c oxidase subunit III n=1 Tax=plant metagenome TaxID=1297885 RepID=A0A484SMB2_9ZZZZ